MRANLVMILMSFLRVAESFTSSWSRFSVPACRVALYSSSPSPSPSATTTMEVTATEKPKWAAGGVVSDLVNILIGIKPLFSLMKLGARQQLISTAEQNGVPWRERAIALEQKQEILDQYYNTCLVESIEYPQYYTREFHAYDEGNLNWPAAYECEQATMSMALRVWPTETLTPKEAQDRLRYSFIDSVKGYINEIALTSEEQASIKKRTSSMLPSSSSSSTPSSMNFLRKKGLQSKSERNVDEQSFNSVGSVDSIVDLGCSVGVSTFYLSEAFPSASVLGVDLSPQFLAVAQERQWSFPVASPVSKNIMFVHGQAEKMDSFIASGSQDLVAACFMFHELPQQASRDILKEMFRITSTSGFGTIAITDNNPGSTVIQRLPAPIFTLMKSTEPWSDEYYAFDLEQAMRQVGFVDVVTIETDPRHRSVLGRRPAM